VGHKVFVLSLRGEGKSQPNCPGYEGYQVHLNFEAIRDEAEQEAPGIEKVIYIFLYVIDVKPVRSGMDECVPALIYSGDLRTIVSIVRQGGCPMRQGSGVAP
jgi:hypothetical protein